MQECRFSFHLGCKKEITINDIFIILLRKLEHTVLTMCDTTQIQYEMTNKYVNDSNVDVSPDPRSDQDLPLETIFRDKNATQPLRGDKQRDGTSKDV